MLRKQTLNQTEVSSTYFIDRAFSYFEDMQASCQSIKTAFAALQREKEELARARQEAAKGLKEALELREDISGILELVSGEKIDLKIEINSNADCFSLIALTRA